MTTTKIKPFEDYVDRYESWFSRYPAVFESEVNALRQQLPAEGNGIEVGIGTGLYAVALGIQEGVDPADKMIAKAAKRGLEVMKGVAENLPYRDLHFDFVLMVTICHFEDIRKAFLEGNRVLKPGGVLVVGMLDKNRPIAQSYEAKRHDSHFYANANFYSVHTVEAALLAAGFRDLNYVQTLFQKLEEIKEPEPIEDGYGKGSYVVIKGRKS